MKLIGSKLEQELKKQLTKSNKSFFKDEEKRSLLEVVRSSYPEMNTAYIIDWIPEQDEDIYKILINDCIIAEIELDRYNIESSPIVITKTISEYLKGLSKQCQIKLAVALELAKQETLKDAE
ncbi:hypothetical protein [Paenibacillus agilis]|uniref:Uncharacterized protein n=1 Tax=Paenibacillus agilis TaxID=3020863 RepID=A0A559IXY9_9BACL|nr:hypothetical protein [Paenibacillus agilis]TVX92500.1 hypothetical protein FPZ44_05190 [Paenibacillus agilis]